MKQKLIEIARSFSYKLNLGNYQTADFFCSQKAEVPEKKAIETSEKLFEFCRDEVMKSVYAHKLESIPILKQPKFTATDFAQARTEAPAEQAKQEQANEIPPEEDKTTEEETTTVPLEEI